jgi:ubiquinone/menaquinone biosynthesis C-methylase UbiE
VDTHNSSSDYLLGNSDAEHERLIRQAARLEPVSEAFFREAGIVAGQRVLDIGSGVGDVSLLLARLVGATGEVVGVERDAKSVECARGRAAAANLKNLNFVQSDVAHFASNEKFDAVAGRFVLQFIPDPAAVLRCLCQHVRPGGIIAFLEGSWAPFLLLSAHLPLWSKAVVLLHRVSESFGVNLEMGPALHKVYKDAGLPVARMRLQMELGNEPEFTRLVSDVVLTLRGEFPKYAISLESLGDLDTLQARLHEEVAASNTVVPWIALVGAYSRTNVG